MANFARLDSDNTILQIIVISDKDCLDSVGNFSEEVGIEFCKSICGEDTNWRQVFSGGVGYTYNEEFGAFIAPKPFDSWILNKETKTWQSPIGLAPQLTQEEVIARSFYRWNEEGGSWVLETPLALEE